MSQCQGRSSLTNPDIRTSVLDWAAIEREAHVMSQPGRVAAMWQHTRDTAEDAWSQAGEGPQAPGLSQSPQVRSTGSVHPHSADYPDPGHFVPVDQRAGRLARLRLHVGLAGHVHGMETAPKGSRPWQAWMLTLTYRGLDDWNPRHVSNCLDLLRKWARRQGVDRFRYVWVAELQKRGAVHYHVVVWLPRQLALPKPDKRGWWPHGMTNVVRARKPVSYLCKYLSKGGGIDEQRLPNRARCYGIGGMDRSGRDLRGWHRLPTFLRGAASASERSHYARADGGGWVHRPTGEWWPSEYVACFSRDHRGIGRLSVARVHTHRIEGALEHVAGPWSRLPVTLH